MGVSVALSAELVALRAQFLVRPDITFLNHGSFGACPSPVSRRIRRGSASWRASRWNSSAGGSQVDGRGARRARRLLGTDADNVIFVPNVTWAINAVARSLDLHPGDEVLATDLEYGAIDRTWRYYCGQRGARYINQPITLPVTTAGGVRGATLGGRTARTRVIAISHITSGTALILPSPRSAAAPARRAS